MENNQRNNQQIKPLTRYTRLFIDNNEIITDKQIIANRFNSFFTNIGPGIALDIEDNSSKKF